MYSSVVWQNQSPTALSVGVLVKQAPVRPVKGPCLLTLKQIWDAQIFLLRQRTWNTELLCLKFFSLFPKCVQTIPLSRKSVVLAHGWLHFFRQSTSLYSISLWLIFLSHFSSKNFIYFIWYKVSFWMRYWVLKSKFYWDLKY